MVGYLETSQNVEVGRRNVEPRDMNGGDRTNKRACTTQRFMDSTSWHFGLAQEMVKDTCENARTFDMEAGRLRGKGWRSKRRLQGFFGLPRPPRGKGAGLPRPNCASPVGVDGIGKLFILCKYNLPGARAVVAQRSRTHCIVQSIGHLVATVQ